MTAGVAAKETVAAALVAAPEAVEALDPVMVEVVTARAARVDVGQEAGSVVAATAKERAAGCRAEEDTAAAGGAAVGRVVDLVSAPLAVATVAAEWVVVRVVLVANLGVATEEAREVAATVEAATAVAWVVAKVGVVTVAATVAVVLEVVMAAEAETASCARSWP